MSEDDGVLQPADSLETDDLRADPLDTGLIPPDRWSAGQKFGTTADEQRQGESLDQLLAEEEPDVDPYAPEPGEYESTGGRRAGRLVAPDEGAHGDVESEMIASDVGIDGGAAGAEEAAVHIVEEE
ncbi:DUF5709 domain-containing protein [Rhizohabitans arisaemae]|uniref:DUF5709 domain-containing protein n=1 Tax=Rhizohabitans arisaemae TaxID=2720610 RepID=UPI0024B25FC4|nr:DUF5709 domain-containing protein [Rhizohabitans arisaemae]